MNKDLDDRLIPNGEYRDAQNISVGKSEADDIGSLETVLGNTLATNFGLSGMTVIGYHAIENSNKIIVFLTNGTAHHIYQFVPSNTANLLVTGSFLNFSLTKPITGISVIENLLFWTDYNNQPRKINIDTAFDLGITYYTNESDISVAKYNPYQPIGLLSKVNTTTTTSGSSSTLVVASTLGVKKGMAVVEYGNSSLQPQDYVYVVNINGGSTFGSLVGGTGYANASGVATTVAPAGGTGLTVNITVTAGAVSGVVIASPGDGYSVNDVITITGGGGNATITLTAISNIVLNATVSGLTSGDTIYFLDTTMTGEEITFNFNNGSSATWPGDPDYLESRFIRLSYRFEFDDGEYSLMAPFTPITFIPKQKGYFLQGDEDSSYRSTIVEFMENGVQNIELLIPFPDTLNNVQPKANASYKIKAVDILYKESDAVAVKVIDTINYNDSIDEANGNTWTATANSNILIYNYQSRKPFRTLPTNQTVRVYDKVPVKAFAQETAGNRIIYGNFLDKYSPPTFLDYIVGVSPKSTSLNFDSWAEFPTQSVKQNRNYQVGFILADKFGRQSDVILSSIKTSTVTSDGTIFGGDTIYSAYNSLTENTNKPIRDWFGDSLKIDIKSKIISTTPGLYANTGTGYNTFQTTINDQPTISGNTYVFKLAADQTEIPIIGSYLPGEFTDYVYVSNVLPQGAAAVGTQYTVTTIGQVSSTYKQQAPASPDVKYAYSLNEVGWYSYKIVVKQQEQDYYNVYLPGILSGYPNQTGSPPPFPSDPAGSTANIVLINDNINKIPRDLSEVGPEQKQFRSSVQLFGRVENNTGTTNVQYYPGVLTDTAISISTADDSNMSFDTLGTNGKLNLYQIDTNPLIARLATNKNNIIGDTTATMRPFLAIYETEPVESLLDIFWETPTVGLISDLNDAIASNYEGAVGWSSFTSNNFTEASTGNFLTNISPVNQSGVDLFNTSISVISVVDGNGNAVSGFNQPTKSGGGTSGSPFVYSFSKSTDEFVFNQDANVRKYTITSTITNNDPALPSPVVSNPLSIDIELQNIIPLINGGAALPVINNNTATSGVIVDVDGVNGAAKVSLNQDQLQWSMTGGDVYFTINSSTGQITQNSASIGTYNLIIILKDANGTGLSSVPVTQQVVVSSTAVGFAFTAGQADGNVIQVCPINGSVAPTCGSITYYNTTTNSGTPQVNDIISTSEFTIVPAGRGFYSFNCGSGTGTSRKYFFIDNSPAGKVVAVTNCT